MADLVPLSAVAAMVTFATLPLVRRALLKQGVVDIPNHRSAHSIATPRGGGLACVLGLVSGAAFAAVTHSEIPWLAVIASLVLAALGYTDDRLHLNPWPRLAAQALVGGALGYYVGGFIWAVAGAAVVLLVVNVVNFMDGINGITALTMILWGSVVATSSSTAAGLGLPVLGSLTAATALGFLPWNAPTAQIFLGDVGSYLFGGLAASGVLISSSTGGSPLVVAAPLAVYLADVSITLLVRALRRAPLFQAHREHVYQRLVHVAGLPHVAVAGWSVVAAGLVVTVSRLSEAWLAITLSAALVALYVASVPLVLLGRSLLISSFHGEESE